MEGRDIQRLPASHPTAVIFVDETGWPPNERLFGVGALKLADPRRTLASIGEIRRSEKFDGPLRWTNLARASQREARAAARALHFMATSQDVAFACVVFDREFGKVEAAFGDLWRGYSVLVERAVAELLDEEEVVAVLLDGFTVPVGKEPEGHIKQVVNRRSQRLAAVAVERVAGGSNDGIQMADLLLGAVGYQLRESRTRKAPRDDQSLRRRLSRRTMTDAYGLTAYHDATGGRTVVNRLSVTVLPSSVPPRGGRGGARKRGT